MTHDVVKGNRDWLRPTDQPRLIAFVLSTGNSICVNIEAVFVVAKAVA
jgi:hypothetical protein